MSRLIRLSVGAALVLATVGNALAAKKHVAPVRANGVAAAHASVPMISDPEYFAQAKGDIQ